MKNSQAPTNETIELLYDLNKSTYNSLKAKNLQNEHLFNIGDTFGGDSDINSSELLTKAELTIATLKEVKESSLRFFGVIKTKINKLKNIEFGSKIITAITGSALLVSISEIFGEGKAWFEIGSAILVTVSSLFNVVLERGLGNWSFNNRNFIDDQHNLSLYNLDAGDLLNDLLVKVKHFNSDSENEEIQKLIQNGNELSRKIKLIVRNYEKVS